MDIIAPVTDYVRASIMTNAGDFLVHSGVAPIRFDRAPAGSIIRTNLAGTYIERITIGSMFNEAVGHSDNAGIITLTGGQTTIATLVLSTLNIGDFLCVMGWMNVEKGGTEGETSIGFKSNAGTGVLNFVNGSPLTQQDFHMPAAAFYNKVHTAFANVQVSGTYTIELYGISLGSNAEVGAYQGGISVWHVR